MHGNDTRESSETVSKIGKRVPDETLDPDSKVPLYQEKSSLNDRSDDVSTSLRNLLRCEMQRLHSQEY